MNRSLLTRLSVSLMLTSVLLAVAIFVFSASGVLILAYIYTLLLVVQILQPVHITNVIESCPAASQFNSQQILHSHHYIGADFKQQEFFIGQKFYCAGCLGLCVGLLVSLSLPSLYAVNILQIEQLTFLLYLAPLCFIGTLIRAASSYQPNPYVRALFYALLPIGSWIIILFIHAAYQSTIYNLLSLLVVVIAWNVGGYRRSQG